MTFENYLFDGSDDKSDTIRLALSLEKELANIKGRTLHEFFERLREIEIAGTKGELYSDDTKNNEFGTSLCKQWVQRKKSGPRNFGVKWVLDDDDPDMFVAVQAGRSNLHVGISCKMGELDSDCGSSQLFGRRLKDIPWGSYRFSSYNLGRYEGIALEILLGDKNTDIVRALEALSRSVKRSYEPVLEVAQS